MRRRLVFVILLLLVGPARTQYQQPYQQANSLEQHNAIPSNHPPVLQVSSTEGYLPETAEIGTTVRVSPNMHSDSLQILVNDDDLKAGMPPATYQYILTGLGATIFAVDQRGYVYLNVPEIDADPPNPSTYQLNVQAREVDTVPVRSSEPVAITIHIMDANDNAPAFDYPIYTANTTATGGAREIVQVRATDVDAGKFGEITYAITQVTNGAEEVFRYDASSNQLIADGDLTPGERYQVVVEGTDGGGRSAQAIVIVLATDGHSQATLAPLPGMETFTFLPDWNPQPVTQEPQHASPLPLEFTFQPNGQGGINAIPTPQAHQQTLQPTQQGESGEETIQTFVTEVSENTPVNTVVVTLGDDSNSDQIYFNIVGGNEEGLFGINEQTGSIITLGELDRERTPMHSLQVETRSRQPDQHLYWTLVQISVLDVNDHAPHFIGPQPIRMQLSVDRLDELTGNMQIGRVPVEDMDSDDNGRVEMRIVPPMDRLFKINNDGDISVNGDFTAEHFGEHQLTVVARDHGDPPRETKGHVTVAVFGTLITMATQTPTGTNDIYEYTQSSETEEPSTDYYQPVTQAPMPNGFSSYPSAPSTNPEFLPHPAPSPATVHQPLFPLTFPPTQPPTLLPDTPSEPLFTQPPVEIFTLPPTTTATLPPPPLTQPRPVSTSRPLPTAPLTTQQPTPAQQLRLAPVFNPAHIHVTVAENEQGIEIAKVHAAYPDGRAGSISYVLLEGDPSMFSVSSFSGSVMLLRPLDAEADTQSYRVVIGTAESAGLRVEDSQSHSLALTVSVGDENDWIPNFESPSYSFRVTDDTLPGTIVGQVAAFDQDREAPNNAIRYRLVSAGGLEQFFSVNQDSGLITLTRPVDAFSGEKITLRIEASDAGKPPQASQTTALIEVEPRTSQLIPDGQSFVSTPNEGQLQFSLRNYTASVSESVRPPHLVQVLSINNKPHDTRFIVCDIVSGNYKGAFGITAGNDGNCELRTQMELDRESVERYLLNVTVTSGEQSDFALVSITVLDVNDNVPKFVYDNDLGLSTYFAAVSERAPAFTRVATVKAVDADLGNSSLVQYSLDLMSMHSKYFSISPSGEISTKQSISHVLQKSRIPYFELRVSACDSPVSGQQLCSKADVIVNVVGEANRFKIATSGLNPQQIRAHEKDLVRSLRQFTGDCSLLELERMDEEGGGAESMPRTSLYWYAVNPDTKKICRRQEFRKLFETSSVQMIAGKVQPWFRLSSISEAGESSEQAGGLPANWKTASILLVVLAVVIAVGGIAGVCAVCVFWNRYKSTQKSMHTYPHGYPPAKMGAIYLPNPNEKMSYHDKIYETQMMEMPISDEDMTMKTNSQSSSQQRGAGGYRNYGRQPSYEGDFSIEESMYAVNAPGRIDPVTKRLQTLVIPEPDYPHAHHRHLDHNINKSIL